MVRLLLAVPLAAVMIPASPSWADPDPGLSTSAGTFLTGPNNGSPDQIAIRYLQAHPARYGVARADLSDLQVASSHTSRHNGVTHVNLIQRVKELEVFGATATVNIAPDGSVIFVGDTLAPRLGYRSGKRALGAVAAVRAAAAALDLAAPRSPQVMDQRPGPARRTTVTGSGISDAPIPARLGWQPTDNGLRLAWQLVIDDSASSHLWNATVDAGSGNLLRRDDWTDHDNLGELNSTLRRTTTPAPAAGPVATPDPVNDGSSYRVFGPPTESPNEGQRSLVRNPADAGGSPYGWHDTDGAAGPESTVTRGNNVHAYQDQDDDDGADFAGSPDGGAGLDYDYPLDLGENPQNYRNAATTNLFYWNNIIHDVTHGYGFDEASGNFQVDNYGRGGAAGDYVHAEAADGGGVNNANFSTPAVDGTGEPRMQMYLWPGAQFGSPNQVVVDGAGSYGASWARFTPAPTSAGLSGQFVYGERGCAANAYPDDLPTGDWIAVVDGGDTPCDHLKRTQVAEALGAGAIVTVHDEPGDAPVLSADMTGPPVGIPAVAVTQEDGAAIKAAAAADGTGSVRKNPEHPGIRDGDLDAGVIIHEYTHGISNRLTGGPTVNCLTGEERMSEGWSDFLAITMLLDPELDDPQGPRGMGTYVVHQDEREQSGIRPRPYSRNMQIQPFTYDSIKTGGWLNGETLRVPHHVGHGWTAILWDMTWDLIDRHGFNRDIYGSWNTGGNNLAMQLVMDGLKFQGCSPGFVRGRDAIIAADAALTGGANACTLWASFARRGLGYSAVQGTTGRDDNAEAFDTHPDCRSDFLNRTPAPALNTVDAGDSVPMRFDIGGYRGLDILATNSPYSRLVDCDTLETVNPDGSITPRPFPVAAETPGSAGLSADDKGRYLFPWKTDAGWAGTCREFVLTLDDGHQFRTYFRFAE